MRIEALLLGFIIAGELEVAWAQLAEVGPGIVLEQALGEQMRAKRNELLVTATDFIVSGSTASIDSKIGPEVLVALKGLLASDAVLSDSDSVVHVANILMLCGRRARPLLPDMLNALEKVDSRWPVVGDIIAFGPPTAPASLCDAIGFVTGLDPRRYGSCGKQNGTWPNVVGKIREKAVRDPS